MGSVKPRQTGAKRGGRAARSEAEWWTPARKDAFEALRRGDRPDVPRRTLEDWQASPYWQAKLAKREAVVEAAATKAEVEPLERLRSYLDGAVDTVGKMATGTLDPCKVRLAAARFIVERFRIEPPPEQSSGSAEVLKRAVAFGEAFVLGCAEAMTTAALRAEQ